MQGQKVRNCYMCLHSNEKTHLQGGGLECRFHPPTALLIQNGNQAQVLSVYPVVEPNNLCSMFHEKPLEPLKVV